MTDGDKDKTTGSPFEKLYLKERKKGQMFIATTFILAGLLVVSVIYSFQNQGATGNQTTSPDQPTLGQFGPGGSRPFQDITEFFESDGSVAMDQVNEIKNSLPEGFEDRFLSRVSTQIDSAADEGEVTKTQAQELKEAFGIVAETDVN